MSGNHKDQYLRTAVLTYLQNRGLHTWTTILQGYPRRYYQFGRDQDSVGWHGLLMGMVTTELQHIQADYLSPSSSRLSLCQWMMMHLRRESLNAFYDTMSLGATIKCYVRFFVY